MHMMEEKKKKPLLHLLLLLLGFTYLVSLGAVPLSRSLKASRNQEPPVLNMADQGSLAQGITGELPMAEEEEFVHGRMDIERNDYPGSGANNRHDPKSPGRG